MWTAENRPRCNRDRPRYPSDPSDEEWGLVEALIPPAKRGGGKRTVKLREVVNGVMYILSTGCQWRYLPKPTAPQNSLFPLHHPTCFHLLRRKLQGMPS